MKNTFTVNLEKFAIWVLLTVLGSLAVIGFPNSNHGYFNIDFKPFVFLDYYMPNNEVEVFKSWKPTRITSKHVLVGVQLPSMPLPLIEQEASSSAPIEKLSDVKIRLTKERAYTQPTRRTADKDSVVGYPDVRSMSADNKRGEPKEVAGGEAIEESFNTSEELPKPGASPPTTPTPSGLTAPSNLRLFTGQN